MKKRPILFSGEMVRAILEGRKTQTRRVIPEGVLWKWTGLDEHLGDLVTLCRYGAPGDRLICHNCNYDNTSEWHRVATHPLITERRLHGGERRRGEVHEYGTGAYSMGGEDGSVQPTTCCPCARCGASLDFSNLRRGDLLWVRETWGYANSCDDPGDHYVQVGYRANTDRYDVSENIVRPCEECLRVYDIVRAEVEAEKGEGADDFPAVSRWRPSIHMPRWASRITLEIVSVRADRLRAITEEDAKAEGCEPYRDTTADNVYRAGFANLWDSTNNARGLAWYTNPWVWIIEFKRIEVPA